VYLWNLQRLSVTKIPSCRLPIFDILCFVLVFDSRFRFRNITSSDPITFVAHPLFLMTTAAIESQSFKLFKMPSFLRIRFHQFSFSKCFYSNINLMILFCRNELVSSLMRQVSRSLRLFRRLMNQRVFPSCRLIQRMYTKVYDPFVYFQFPTVNYHLFLSSFRILSTLFLIFLLTRHRSVIPHIILIFGI